MILKKIRMPRDPRWWQAKGLSLLIFSLFLTIWSYSTRPPGFDASGKTEDELMLLEFNGDIVSDGANGFIANPEKTSGVPGPLAVAQKTFQELSRPFHKNGTNDHGIGNLVLYTLSRFSVGFVLASVVAILVGVLIGLNPVILDAVNPFLQVLKPISPLAWMPLLLYTVQKPAITAIMVVFMASLWPTIANTAFGLASIDKDYLRVSKMLEFGWFRRLFTVILPAAAPAIVAGLRISFGSALVAVVPAEMLLGELGVGYLTWIEWNNLDIAGVLFAILVVGLVGFAMDALFSRLSKAASYAT